MITHLNPDEAIDNQLANGNPRGIFTLRYHRDGVGGSQRGRRIYYAVGCGCGLSTEPALACASAPAPKGLFLYTCAA